VTRGNKFKAKFDKPSADPKTNPLNPKMLSLWSVPDDCRTLVGEFMDPTQPDNHTYSLEVCAFAFALLVLVLPI